MTDNGPCYKSFAFRNACKRLRLKHIRTRPYTPKTNGKAERFIQTSLREWAYAYAYNTSNERAAELPRWLHRYNWHRPHGGIQSQTPIRRSNREQPVEAPHLAAAGLKTVCEIREASDEMLLSLPDLAGGSVGYLRQTLGLPSCDGVGSLGKNRSKICPLATGCRARA